jgi:20S proteasome subunit alpha 7
LHNPKFQYDLSASQFSPDGRVFQVEYAMKAVENSGTVIGLRGKDGVVLAAEKLVMSKLHEAGTNKRIFNIDKHVGMVNLTFSVDFLIDVSR